MEVRVTERSGIGVIRQRRGAPVCGATTGQGLGPERLSRAAAAGHAARYEQHGEQEPHDAPPGVGGARPTWRRRLRCPPARGSGPAPCARGAAAAGRRRWSRLWGRGVRLGRRAGPEGGPQARPRSGRPGPVQFGLRTRRPSTCPPGSAHSGPTGPRRGRHRKLMHLRGGTVRWRGVHVSTVLRGWAPAPMLDATGWR